VLWPFFCQPAASSRRVLSERNVNEAGTPESRDRFAAYSTWAGVRSGNPKSSVSENSCSSVRVNQRPER